MRYLQTLMKEHQIDRLRRILDSRLRPGYLAPMSAAIVAITVSLAVAMSLNPNHGRTMFGIPFGADFAGFYVAAEILNRGQLERLYDRDLHYQLYHELLPGEDQQAAIPYIHPPFVAGLLRPLAGCPYPTAVVIWLTISICLYLAGIALMMVAAPWPVAGQQWLVVLLACSFEPFAFECWLGGQLSAIGFFSFALCFAALQRRRPVWAGIGLGICFYKPTLLILVLPLLVIGRRWWMIAGMTITGLVLVGLSCLLVGWDVNVGYLGELLSFNRSLSGSDLEIRTWKYVDLNNCLRTWLGSESQFRWPTFAAVSLLPFLLLCRTWQKFDNYEDQHRRLVWAVTLIWVPVLNLYFGIYDSIVVLQGVYIIAVRLCENSRTTAPLISTGFAYFLLLLFVIPWLSQPVAAMSGLPLYTLLLGLSGISQLGCLSRTQSQLVQSLPSAN